MERKPVFEKPLILLLDKEEGLSSRDCDNKIQRLFHTRKVGHLGTLDPFATGLLVLGIEKGNKYLPYLDSSTKTYIAELKLGIKTSTGDLTAEVVESSPIPSLTKEEILACFASFLGKGTQIPPMTSAIKINGQELYKLAHQGKEVERQPREIEIFSLDLLSFSEDTLLFQTKVSSGTYIRVLGEDIAVKLGTVGHLTALRRTEVGSIKVRDAVKLENVTVESLVNPAPYVACPCLEVSLEEAKKAKNGMTMRLPSSAGQVLLTYEGEGLAIYELRSDGYYHSLRGLF